MPDPGAKAVDELIGKLEKRFNTQYSTAVKEETKKLKEFLKEYDEQNKKKKKQVEDGELDPDEYEDWLRAQSHKRTYLEQMVNTLSADAVLVNAKAMSAVRGYLPEAYAINRNYGIYQIEAGSLTNISWTLYDRSTVERLIRDRPNLLPEPSPDIPKDMRWHKQKITNAITQGILQGEDIPKIATRLQAVTDMDRRAAVRNARTAMTGAQNAGRVDSYKYAQSIGIELEQEWLATLDAHTRDSHREMDGERAEVGAVFSNDCLYPGDPGGPPAEVYNCRCTLVPVLAELDQSAAERISKLEDEDYDEWKYGKENTEERKVARELKVAQHRFSLMEDKTYAGIWKEPVKLSDYEAKAASIEGKREYYENQLRRLSPDSPKYAEFKNYLAQLKEFERMGQKYTGYRSDIIKYSSELARLQGKDLSPFSMAAYSEMRKAMAERFATIQDGDKYFRPLLDAQWDKLTEEQKYAVWKYTENSNPLNKPLSGYGDTWDRYSYVGVGKSSWSREDKYSHRINPSQFRRFGHSDGHIDHAATIRDLTMALDKTSLTDDVWLTRGGASGGLAGLLEGGVISYRQAERLLNAGKIDQLREIIRNQEFQSHAFMSASTAGVSETFSGNIRYSIYAPRGTHAIYAEPQSHWGGTIGKESRHWRSKEDDQLYKPGMAGDKVSDQAEVIIQRGTTYRIVDIRRAGDGKIDVVMEVVNQPDYFRSGFEQTIDGGKTEFRYSGRH